MVMGTSLPSVSVVSSAVVSVVVSIAFVWSVPEETTTEKAKVSPAMPAIIFFSIKLILSKPKSAWLYQSRGNTHIAPATSHSY
ncbi:hypothetical protein [uncultured Ruminococcus sp.]|uniref:hypothetical protein n=1 Tax=uncultured Ruminococcus sp. TaxID=165186 RepID=UPI0025ED7D33|nr:hypothetical protein [uncultured Ruminococcus sp.]